MRDRGGISGSRPTGQAPTGLDAPRIDPGRVAAMAAKQIREKDPYLIDYLLGWFGLADPQPWGAAMSFALEVAHGYGLIKGESDTTATPLGLAVADILNGANQ